jgi:hypothetical protein
MISAIFLNTAFQAGLRGYLRDRHGCDPPGAPPAAGFPRMSGLDLRKRRNAFYGGNG